MLTSALRVHGLEADNPNIHPDGVPIVAGKIADLIDDEDSLVARVCRVALLEVLKGAELGPTRSRVLDHPSVH